jgi:tetratricopeptide (TPR) repeat protein
MNPESPLTRLWNLVKPPPSAYRPVYTPAQLALRRRQRRLVLITVAAVAILAAGVALWMYLQNAPQRAEQAFQDGMKQMHPGKYPDAVAQFTRVLDITPQRADAYLQRGNAHRILGDLDAALADFRSAEDLNPSLADAHNGIALIYLGRNDSRHAMEELNKSISVKPTAEAYYQRGQLFENQGDHQKAIEDYDRAIAEVPDAPFVYRARALSKMHLGDNDGAHEDRVTATRLERR